MSANRLFLSYNNADRTTVVAVQKLLEARGITTFLDRDNLVVGRPWPQALEEGLRSVSCVAVFLGRELGGWQRREMWFALDRQVSEEKQNRAFPVIPVLLPGADLTPGFLFTNTWIDLRAGFDGAVLTESLDAFELAINSTQPAQVPERAAGICPYRGLEVVREEDAAFFFGRKTFAEKLLDFTLRNDLVTVVGPSGSGKSSLVQAGLLPLLRRQQSPANTWDAIRFTPGNEPFHRLASVLIPLLEPDKDEVTRLAEAERLGADLATCKTRVEAVLNRVIEKSNGTNRVLVIADQFEELFTLTPDPSRRRFAEALLRTLGKGPFTLLITLRADFYSQIITVDRELSDCFARAQVNIGALTPDELRECVTAPAKLVGLRFEQGLVERILTDVGSEPGSLPLLEYALTELWQRRSDNLLTHACYDAIGGVSGAISKRAEQQIDRLSPLQRQIAMSALSRLVRVSAAGDGESDTRQVVRMSELDGEAAAVMRIFAAREARLVVLGRDEVVGEESVQVAHEALIRGWGKLKAWIDADREFLIWRQQLKPFVDKWRGLQRGKEAALLQGIYLAEAKRWLRERASDLSVQERQFVQASEAPVSRSRLLKRLSLATVPALFLGLLSAADRGFNFPASKELRQWIDELNISVARHPKTVVQLREALPKLTSDLVELIDKRRSDDGWIHDENQADRKAIDYWLNAQAVCALLHGPQINDDNIRFAANELTMLFESGRPQIWSGKKYGWLSESSSGILHVEPLLWTGSALAALASRSLASAEPWSAEKFRQSVAFVQESSTFYHNDTHGGWWIYPQLGAVDPYATILATQMLMDFRDAHVPWPGSESLIKRNIEWLLGAYQSSGHGMAGWKTQTAVETVPGLSLQAYALLLRAQAHGDKPIPQGILDRVSGFVKNGFQDSGIGSFNDMAVLPLDFAFKNPKDGASIRSSLSATQFLWYPWAVECTARWLDLQHDRDAALRSPLVRRTLTSLLLTENEKYVKKDAQFTFRYAELLYSLGSLSNSLQK